LLVSRRANGCLLQLDAYVLSDEMKITEIVVRDTVQKDAEDRR